MASTAKGVSIHFGLNRVDPDHYQGWDGALQGCVNDAELWMPSRKEPDSRRPSCSMARSPRTPQPQRSRAVAESLDADDLFLLTYSGHGSQVQTATRTSPTGKTKPGSCTTASSLTTSCTRCGSNSDRACASSCSRTAATAAPRCAKSSSSPARALAGAMSVPPPNGMRAMPRRWHRRCTRRTSRPTTGSRLRFPPRDRSRSARTWSLLSRLPGQPDLGRRRGNGLFTQTLLEVWEDGHYEGGHRRFWREIVKRMPPWQSPNWFTVGPTNTAFVRRRPFTI